MAYKPRPPLKVPRLENEKHEIFARCVANGNQPAICYYGVGYEHNPDAAWILADSKAIRARCEEIYAQNNPWQYRNKKYTHITDL